MEELKLAFHDHETAFELIQGEGGVLNIVCNGQEVFDKHGQERWPAYREIPELVSQQILGTP